MSQAQFGASHTFEKIFSAQQLLMKSTVTVSILQEGSEGATRQTSGRVWLLFQDCCLIEPVFSSEFFIDFREKETWICSSAYFCIHLVLLVCALVGDQTHNQLSCRARA